MNKMMYSNRDNHLTGEAKTCGGIDLAMSKESTERFCKAMDKFWNEETNGKHPSHFTDYMKRSEGIAAQQSKENYYSMRFDIKR